MAVGLVIDAGALSGRLEPLLRIGRDERGTTRLAWTVEDAAASAWFAAQASSTGLTCERDAAGNLWAVPDAPSPWWAIGSHLDSVVDGGSYDGALGVAAGFEVAARADVPVCVISFADEEGARFNPPTFGSRALAGTLDPAVLERVDAHGTTLRDAMEGAGVPVAGLAHAREEIGRLRGFVELHVDQTLELVKAGRPYGVVSGLAARTRLRAELRGRADHSGTTHGSERHDALAAAARLIVAGQDLAERDGVVCTATRIEVEPNALTTVPARASAWLDLRAGARADVEAVHAALRGELAGIATRTGAHATLYRESDSPGGELDPDLRARLRVLAETRGEGGPELLCYAGHDAGVLAARLPTAMILVRNPTGVSHAPEEAVELRDAARAADLALALLEQIA